MSNQKILKLNQVQFLYLSNTIFSSRTIVKLERTNLAHALNLKKSSSIFLDIKELSRSINASEMKLITNGIYLKCSENVFKYPIFAKPNAGNYLGSLCSFVQRARSTNFEVNDIFISDFKLQDKDGKSGKVVMNLELQKWQKNQKNCKFLIMVVLANEIHHMFFGHEPEGVTNPSYEMPPFSSAGKARVQFEFFLQPGMKVSYIVAQLFR